jgi:hypothetical protein
MAGRAALFELVEICALGVLLALVSASAQQLKTVPDSHSDTDHDGLSDALEQRLLEQFRPRFLVAEHDCAGLPARFKADDRIPEAAAEDGTIYGQVFPVKRAGGQETTVEIHYYDLWKTDCGSHGHPLDAEHVAVLLRASDADLASAHWKAVYWYAAAHENTVCDVSQISRASTLGAENRGAAVWVSAGKHAAYLDQRLCGRGCGADRCDGMIPLTPVSVINLGEAGSPMNGSLFIAYSRWPLLAKMTTSDFPAAPIARLEQLPPSDIAWFHAGRRPVQGVIARSSSTEKALADSGRDTTSAISSAAGSTAFAISVAGDSTNDALAASGDKTGSALGKSYEHTVHALGASAERVGKALHLVRTKNNRRQ